MDDHVVRAFGVTCEIVIFPWAMFILLSVILIVCKISILVTLLGTSASWGFRAHGLLDTHPAHYRGVIISIPYWQYYSPALGPDCAIDSSPRLWGWNISDRVQQSRYVVLC